jgi:two-component system, cell cycle sensor histidine kinase and response regulator CckA
MQTSTTDSTAKSLGTILAVDDDQAVLGFLDHSLRMAGYHVLLADSGWSAIDVYEKNKKRVDLLLTDVIMPDLTGPVVAERLRARQPDLRVLFISGFHDADVVRRYVMRDGFTLLPKPFTLDGLLRVVEESLASAPR